MVFENKDYRKGKYIGQRDTGGRFYRSPSLFWDKYKCLNYPERCGCCIKRNEKCASGGGYYEICYKKGNGGAYDRCYEEGI